MPAPSSLILCPFTRVFVPAVAMVILALQSILWHFNNKTFVPPTVLFCFKGVVSLFVVHVLFLVRMRHVHMKAKGPGAYVFSLARVPIFMSHDLF